MYIGQLAKACGVTPKTIRHYEALGLLGVVRRAGAYRVYEARAIEVVRLIRQGQALGFKLSELGFLDPANPDWALFAEQIALKQRAIAADIARLQGLDRMLAQALLEVRACPQGDATVTCA